MEIIPENNTKEPINNNQKKSKKSVIIALIIVAITVIGIMAIILGKTHNENLNGETQSNRENSIKKGDVELTFTSKDTIFIQKNSDMKGTQQTKVNDYFKTKIDGETKSIDSNGKELTCQTAYLGDGYYIERYEDPVKRVIYKDSQEIFVIDENGGNIAYKNNILYYTENLKNVVAYDLKNKKELWRTEGNNLYLDETFIKMNPLKYYTTKDRTIQNSKIVSLNGEIIVEATSNYYDIYPTSTEYYLKVKSKGITATSDVKQEMDIEVYDFEHNKISAISLKEEGINYTLKEVLPNGMYIIYEYDMKNNTFMSKLYNIYSEVIEESNSVISDKIQDKEYAIVEIEGTSALLKADGTGILKKGYMRHNSDYISLDNTLIKLNTEKILEISDGIGRINQSSNGNYIIVQSAGKYYIYDSELKLIYETSNYLDDINDEYVLEKEQSTGKLYILNIFTGDKKAIETKGKYYSCNSAGIITYDEENYYLYAFR